MDPFITIVGDMVECQKVIPECLSGLGDVYISENTSKHIFVLLAPFSLIQMTSFYTGSWTKERSHPWIAH